MPTFPSKARDVVLPAWDIDQPPLSIEYKFFNMEEIIVKESSSPLSDFCRAFTRHLLTFHTPYALFKSQEVLSIRAVSALLLSMVTGLA